MTAPTTERPVREDELEVETEPRLGSGEQDTQGREFESEAYGSRTSDSPVRVGGGAAVEIAYRPMLAAALSASAAALVTGGIFGSWFARLLAMFAVLFGVFWAWLALRSPERETTYQMALVPASLLVGIILVIPAGDGGASALPQLVRDAISSGRLLRPPVPFDPGWRPIFMVVFALLGFGAAWLASALGRPRAAIAVPLPILALTAITQPDDGQFIAGLCAFVPLIAALAVLFGGDASKASELTRDFELKRALRGGAAGLAAIVALVLLGNASFLFPDPAYDPSDQPQKPRPIPLSQVEDRVLFEIKTDAGITGPWKTGALDIYDGKSWKLPPFDKTRFVNVPDDGVVDPVLAPIASKAVDFTLRALGNSTSLPVTTTTAKVEKPSDLGAQWDPRVGVLRMPEGRAPENVSYRVWMPAYPDAAALGQAPPRKGDFREQLAIPDPPDAISRLLTEAPQEAGFARLDFLRKRLRELVVAVGGGVAKDVTPERVAEIIEDPAHEASPFEIVAAEAMLARWAGVPSRIGYGFDGFNDEDGIFTVRPKNAAQWLEVYFEGHGWVPLIEAPEQAKQSLDNDENAQFDPDIVASDEVAVDLYIPIKLESIRLLYERVREQLLAALPYALVLLAGYLATPAAMKQLRRYKRRRWAQALGPRAQITVEYAEFRDLAHDLNLGDPLDTPLEYLKKIVDDEEHQELAWLVSRSLYGDLAPIVTDEDARSAEELSSSLRRRLFRAQPLQSRVIGFLTRASLRQPYTTEVPNITLLDPIGRWSALRSRRRAARAMRRRTRRLRGMLGGARIPALQTGRRS